MPKVVIGLNRFKCVITNGGGGISDCINIDLKIRLCNLSTQNVFGR